MVNNVNKFCYWKYALIVMLPLKNLDFNTILSFLVQDQHWHLVGLSTVAAKKIARMYIKFFSLLFSVIAASFHQLSQNFTTAVEKQSGFPWLLAGWRSNTLNLEPPPIPLQPHTFERREHPESQRSHCKERSFYFCTLVHHHGLGDGNVMWIKVFW